MLDIRRTLHSRYIRYFGISDKRKVSKSLYTMHSERCTLILSLPFQLGRACDISVLLQTFVRQKLYIE